MQTIQDRTDRQIQDDVISELKYEPQVKATDVGVVVKNGTVTLTGFASSYGEKWAATRAAKRVAGVEAIADEIEIRLLDSHICDDSEIATAAAHRLAWLPSIPVGSVQPTVRGGWITLEGEVEWNYQRKDAEESVRHMRGVHGITNAIAIKPLVTASNIVTAIVCSLERSAVLDASKIEVEAKGHTVTLRGKVRSYAEKEDAENAAWNAPGVSLVDNQLKVKWFSAL
jgi:osmotically-inducible protein OsmY